MLNVFDASASNENRSLYGAEDFIMRLSAFDEAVNQNFGLSGRRQLPVTHDFRTNRVRLDVRTCADQIPPIKRDVQRQKIKSKLNTPELVETKVNGVEECKSVGSNVKRLNENEFVLRVCSNSVPNSLDKRTEDNHTKSKSRQKRLRFDEFVADHSNQPGGCDAPVAELDQRASEDLRNLELNELTTDCSAIAVGLPNIRSLSNIPSKPRYFRARQYFLRLKKGLKDWIESQTTQIEQAELDQNNKVVNKETQLLNRIQQRLHTVTQLEEEYNRHWKLYTRIQTANSQYGLVPEQQTNLLLHRELSKSAETIVKAKSTQEPGSLESRHSVTLVKQPWFSSMMNVMRTRSKKKISSPTDSIYFDQNLDDKSTWNRSLSGDLYGANFKQMIITTPKRHKSRAHNKNSKTRIDSLYTSNQRQEEFVKKQLCDIEAQVEYLSGTFKCEVIGISGPCQYLNRDEFKVSLKQGSPVLHSLYELDGSENALLPLHKTTLTLLPSTANDQKWSSHGRVKSNSNLSQKNHGSLLFDLERNGEYVFPKQTWDHPGYIFSPTIDGVFTLKVAESKKFGKDEILLHQAFDLTGLFTAKGYHLSTPLRNHGQVRFNLLIRWCPLADTDDEGFLYYTSPSVQVVDFSSKNKQKSNNIRFILNDSSDSPYSSKMDSLHALESDGTRSGTSARNSQMTDFTHSHSTLFLDKVEHKKSLSVIELDDARPYWSKSRPPKVTIINENSSDVKSETNWKAPIKHWVSMPNLEESALRKSSTTAIEFNILPRLQEQVQLEHYPHHLDVLSKTSQSVSVTSSSRSSHHVQSRNPSSIPRTGIMDKVLLVQRKLAQSKNCNSLFLEIFQQLECALNNLNEALENKQTEELALSPSTEIAAYSSAISDTPRVGKKQLGKQDTLSSLWESFAFLQESFEHEESPKGRNASKSSPKHSSSACSDIIRSTTSTGWNQLDMALMWHLDYIERLLDRLAEHEITVDCPRTTRTEESVLPPLLSTRTKHAIDFVATPMRTCWMALALMGQNNVLKRAAEVIKDLNVRPQSTPLRYVTSIVGGDDGIKVQPCRQCIYPLVWTSSNEDLEIENNESDEPLLMLDVRELQKILHQYYTETVAHSWPDVDSRKVIELFLADLLDVTVNGENVFSVPLTHLEQRLQLLVSEDMETDSIQQTRRIRTSDNIQYTSLLNDRLREIFLYLAGQCYVQKQLQGSNRSYMLFTLPQYKRSYQELFDWSKNLVGPSQSATTFSSGRAQSMASKLNSLRVLANHSTKTWLKVASCISSSDHDVANRAIKLLTKSDNELIKLSEYIFSKIGFPHSMDKSLLYGNNYLPVLFANGPPLLCHLALSNILFRGQEEFGMLPPLWMSMLWGIDEQRQYTNRRMEALHGLAILYEQKFLRLQIKSTHLFRATDLATSVDAVTRLISHLGTNDNSLKMRRFAKRVLQKLELHAQNKVQSPLVITDRSPLKLIWNPSHSSYNP